MATPANLKQPLHEVFLGAATEIIKKDSVRTYIIMPLNRTTYTVFDRDTLMDCYNADADGDASETADCDAVVASIKCQNGSDWNWGFTEPDPEKPVEFTGSLKGCLRDMVQRLDDENGQQNRYTVIARMYNMMDPEQLQTVVSGAVAYPAAEFLARQGIELETASQRFLSENMDGNWKPTDARFGTVCFYTDDAKVDPEHPVDHAEDAQNQAAVAKQLIGELHVKCWNVSVENGYYDGVQLVVKNRLNEDFDGDAALAVHETAGDGYSSVCQTLATIANNNETDIMKRLQLSPVKINSVFSLMGFARSYQNGKYVNIPNNREADMIALDEIGDEEDHFYEVVWETLSEREALVITTSLVEPLVSRHNWTIWNGNAVHEDTPKDIQVSQNTVNTIANDVQKGTKLLFGGGDGSETWTRLEWQSSMSVGQRTAKSIEVTERMFGETELNFLVKDGMDPLKFYELRKEWKAHPLLAIAYDMDFAAQYVSDYMNKVGVTSGQVGGGEYGTLLFTSTFTNGSRLFADDQGRVFLNLAFGGSNEYPEDITTNNATLLSWCMETFDPKNNPKASNFYTNIRNYLQTAMNRWADVRISVKMSGSKEEDVLQRFTTLMENFPERRSDTNDAVSKFNNYVFNAYNPMENLNRCIDNLSKGNVTVV